MIANSQVVTAKIAFSSQIIIRRAALIALSCTLLIGAAADAQTNPFANGKKIALRADDGGWMMRCNGCVPASIPNMFILDRTEVAGVHATFTVIAMPDGKIMLEADNGEVMSRCNGCVPGGTVPDFMGTQLSARNTVYARFETIRLTNGRFALRADNGKYLARCGGCAPRYGSFASVLTAHENSSDAPYAQWEVVDMTPQAATNPFVKGNRIALRADNGEWMTRCYGCMPASSPSMIVLQQNDPPNVHATFGVDIVDGKVVLEVGNGEVMSRCNGCVPGGTVPDFVAGQESARNAAYAKFELTELPGGKYALKADNGRFLARCGGCSPSLGPSRSVVTAHSTSSAAAYAQWDVVDLTKDPLNDFIAEEKSQIFHDIWAQISRLNTEPTDGQIDGTYSSDHLFNSYIAGSDHVGGIAQLWDGRKVLAHSTRPGKRETLLAVETGERDTRMIMVGNGNHPGGMQAAGYVVVVPIYGGDLGDSSEVVFVDARRRDAPAELGHLRFTSPGHLNAAGIVFHPRHMVHYLITTHTASYNETRPLNIYKSNGKSLFDPNCQFQFFASVDSVMSSQGGTQLLYEDSGDLYVAALFRAEPEGEEGKSESAMREMGTEFIALTRITSLEPMTPKAQKVGERKLSDSGINYDYFPGFRWGGTIANRGRDLLAISVGRDLTVDPVRQFARLRVWTQPGR